MGKFEYEYIKNHCDINDYPICVETGTNLGYSTDIIMKLFKKVFTIEIDKILYEKAVEKYKDTNVECIFGDSAVEIKKLTEKIDNNCIFYLDAHWSGDNTTNWDKSNWKGYGIETGYRGEKIDKPTSRQQTPLEDEIDIINDKCKCKCIIYIDDMDKFDDNGQGKKDTGFNGEDWSDLNINIIIKKLKSRLIYKNKFENQLILILNNI